MFLNFFYLGKKFKEKGSLGKKLLGFYRDTLRTISLQCMNSLNLDRLRDNRLKSFFLNKSLRNSKTLMMSYRMKGGKGRNKKNLCLKCLERLYLGLEGLLQLKGMTGSALKRLSSISWRQHVTNLT